MVVSVLPSNQIAAVKSVTAMYRERIISDCAVAFTKQNPGIEPDLEAVDVFLRGRSLSKSEADDLSADVAALAQRIYRGEVAC